MDNEITETLPSTSAAPAAPKYRNRFQIKPNLNAKRPAAAAIAETETETPSNSEKPEKISTDVDPPVLSTPTSIPCENVQISERLATSPSTSTPTSVHENILNVSQSTPVLTSLLTSPSKYRQRYQAKPNLNPLDRKLNNFVDDVDSSLGTNPIVAASAVVSQKVNDPPTRTNKRRFESSRELDRSLFTMADLIYWNPDNGSGLKKDSEDDLLDAASVSKPEADKPKETSSNKDDGVFAPQVRVNADGSIVIDETSLTVKKTKEDIGNLETVRESNKCKNSRLTSFSFRRNPISRPKTWNETDTDKFYRILKMVGTDFSMMAEYFPKRKRNELKNKFRKECKENPTRIDSAMKRGSSPLQIPKRLLRLNKIADENERDDDDENQSDVMSVASKSHAVNSDDDSDDDVEEQIENIFKRPTRSGRVPKPVKLPQMGSVESVPKWKRTKRQKFAVNVVESLKTPKQDATQNSTDPGPSSRLTAPGPSTFPKYIPSAVPSTPTFENGETRRIISTDSPGQQLLLVHEKSKEPGKPDLVHIYLVSSPSSASNPSPSPQLTANRRTPSIISTPRMVSTPKSISTPSDTRQNLDASLGLDAADAINRSIENELSLTIGAETEIAVNMEAESNSDIILIDI